MHFTLELIFGIQESGDTLANVLCIVVIRGNQPNMLPRETTKARDFTDRGNTNPYCPINSSPDSYYLYTIFFFMDATCRTISHVGFDQPDARITSNTLASSIGL